MESAANGLIKSLRMRGNESSTHRRLFLYVCNAPNPRGTPPGHPGDMNVAPTWADCGIPVGAPLVTPGAGTAQRNARERNSARPGEPRGTPFGHPGDMNVAPTVAKRIRRGKRRGATCDARCRNGTMESVANESAANESAANGIRRKRIRRKRIRRKRICRKRNPPQTNPSQTKFRPRMEFRPPQESRPGRWLCISVNKRLPLQACREKQISLSDERYGISTSLHATQPF